MARSKFILENNLDRQAVYRHIADGVTIFHANVTSYVACCELSAVGVVQFVPHGPYSLLFK